MSVKLNAVVEVDQDSFGQLDHEEALELIKAIDLQNADVDFTEGVIKALLESLCNDYTKDEMVVFIASLSRFEGKYVQP